MEVLRLNTYTTRQVSSISDEALRLARQARVLAIASPSAIKCAPSAIACRLSDGCLVMDFTEMDAWLSQCALQSPVHHRPCCAAWFVYLGYSAPHVSFHFHGLHGCRAWAQIAGLEGSPAVACIGSTSAKAARTLGLSQVYSPVRPGLDGFVDSIMEALGTSPAAAAA